VPKEYLLGCQRMICTNVARPLSGSANISHFCPQDC
jgi:hypothetical protein